MAELDRAAGKTLTIVCAASSLPCSTSRSRGLALPSFGRFAPLASQEELADKCDHHLYAITSAGFLLLCAAARPDLLGERRWPRRGVLSLHRRFVRLQPSTRGSLSASARRHGLGETIMSPGRALDHHDHDPKSVDAKRRSGLAPSAAAGPQSACSPAVCDQYFGLDQSLRQTSPGYFGVSAASASRLASAREQARARQHTRTLRRCACGPPGIAVGLTGFERRRRPRLELTLAWPVAVALARRLRLSSSLARIRLMPFSTSGSRWSPSASCGLRSLGVVGAPASSSAAPRPAGPRATWASRPGAQESPPPPGHRWRWRVAGLAQGLVTKIGEAGDGRRSAADRRAGAAYCRSRRYGLVGLDLGPSRIGFRAPVLLHPLVSIAWMAGRQAHEAGLASVINTGRSWSHRRGGDVVGVHAVPTSASKNVARRTR